LFHSLLGVLYAAVRRPALLHIHGIGPGMVTPLARLLGLRVVATHHGKDYEREKWGRWRAACCAGAKGRRCCDQRGGVHFAGVQRGTAQQLSPRCGSCAQRVDLLRPVPPGATLARHGLAAGRYVVNVARIVPEKRQLDLIAAFQQADLPEDVRLVLIGGADHEADYVRQVRQAAARDPRGAGRPYGGRTAGGTVFQRGAVCAALHA
jgi:glycosyltransferase involved in cell wall biosynthesis